MKRAWLLVAVACSGSSSSKPRTRDAATPPIAVRVDAAAPAPAPAGPRPVQLAIGWATVLIRMSDGTLRGWGSQGPLLARSDPAGTVTPQVIEGVAGAVELVIDSDGMPAACTRDAADHWTCWGNKDDLPEGGTGVRAPGPEPLLEGAAEVHFGAWWGCALRADHHVMCWGKIPRHESSLDDEVVPPAEVPGLEDVVDLALDSRHACVLRVTGEVLCWGADELPPVTTPTAVGVTGEDELVAGYGLDCVRNHGRGLTCWGADRPPAEIDDPPGGRFVADGGLDLCEVGADHVVRCLSHTDATWQLQPGPLATDFARNLLDETYCALTTAGAVACAGKNDRGQLGDGTLIDHQDLRPVADVVTPRAIPDDIPLPDDPDARSTAFAGRPDDCAIDPSIAIARPAWDGGDLQVVSAWARLGDSDLQIMLRDHVISPERAFDIDLRGARHALELQAMLVGPSGEYDLRTPTRGTYPFAVKVPKRGRWAGGTLHASSDYLDFSEDPPLTGTLTITHIDDAWVCGKIDARAKGGYVRGRFAAERVSD